MTNLQTQPLIPNLPIAETPLPEPKWNQSTANWASFLPQTLNHQLKYQFMVQKMAMAALGTSRFPGYSYQYSDSPRVCTESTYESEEHKGLRRYDPYGSSLHHIHEVSFSEEIGVLRFIC
jgi:hypothetical protein